MLILKAFVNEKQIDEIHIGNIRPIGSDDGQGLYEYKICKPTGDYLPIYHRRDHGWKGLAWAALGRLITKDKERKD